MVTAVFFFNDTATTEIYTLSLHDALPISQDQPLEDTKQGSTLPSAGLEPASQQAVRELLREGESTDRKSTRLNSSHVRISYAVFCLKKKNTGETLSHAGCWFALGSAPIFR